MACPHARIGIELLGNHRLLEPVDAVFSRTIAERDGFGNGIAVIGVDHQPHIRPDRFAHGGNDRKILLDAETDLDLAGVKTLCTALSHLIGIVGDAVDPITLEAAGGVGAHAFAPAPAEQHGDGGAVMLSLDIPQRYIDAGQGCNAEAALATVAQGIVKHSPDLFGLAGIPPISQPE